MEKNVLRKIPSIQKISESKSFIELCKTFPRHIAINELRLILDSIRISNNNNNISVDLILNNLDKNLQDLISPQPRKIINTSGVILQTNLGRAPLANNAIKAMNEAGSNYTNLEFDLTTNKRGGRLKKFKNIINRLTSAEDAIVVNNNASAVFLGLKALCKNKNVLVSRSESVEIGGGFRVPDVLDESQAILVDVGTTNKTYVSDYESHIDDNTGAVLLIHQSNFVIEGFTHKPDIKEIVQMAHKHKVPVFYDLGSGSMINTEEFSIQYEPTVQDAIKDGVDLVFFSGDKLIGGPQSGIIAGKEKYVQLIEKYPLTRALRLDKVLLAGLIATLQMYITESYIDIPIWNMISKSKEDMLKIVKNWKNKLDYEFLTIEESKAMIGGGSMPEQHVNSYSLSINFDSLSISANQFSKKMINKPTPLIGRVKDNKFILDPRTLFDKQDVEVFKLLEEELKLI
ncbi:MAG: L-seryl-tRNA(Sec) selenium transferase [Chloroflexi bacterium]|jgi:L-seryl-tRNA(Ser) seleniumtransferase|nr:L-seryl-tRNA(Sec) selenium transferase [Chloroflexota bacterium]MDP7195718.1 L-seryl-tRNA(Sec) selenium transferase [SAR202 cluster bacterium]|tara:strand:+ start:298 stop:1668 length:1371 start_codon:yes stop_codon:yes gene_type:complete